MPSRLELRLSIHSHLSTYGLIDIAVDPVIADAIENAIALEQLTHRGLQPGKP